MFFLAILLAVYGYGFFFLGIAGVLYGWVITAWTILCLVILLFFLKKQTFHFKIPETFHGRLALLFILMLCIVNFIGVLSPETSFDALWYHLTLPKVFLNEQAIRFIPGGLFYYSVMPKLGEMLFVPALFFGNELWAKAIQYVFGLLTTVAIYKVSRRYMSQSVALLASLIFYSNIVVAWESTVAYVDLIRAFYEIMGLWAFLLWVDTKKQTWLYLSALMIGFAICTKLLAVGTVLLFTILIIYVLLQQKNHSWRNMFFTVCTYGVISIGVTIPWLLFSYLSTGNPVYPFFTPLYPVNAGQILSLQGFFHSLTTLFLFAADPISPVYLILLPLVCISFSKLKTPLKIIGYYSLLALALWYITPNTGGGRFIVPYLPAWSILAIVIIEQVKKQKLVYSVAILCIFITAFITIAYRGVANKRYIPVITGQETKDAFLTKNLNFSFGDFYDTDGYFRSHIKDTDKVLLYGFHNLYYVSFPFIDSSYVKKGDRFTHIATQNTTLPQRFSEWSMVYENPTTFVRLYKKGNTAWVY